MALIDRQVAIDAWKEDFKGFVNSLDMPRDDYKGIMEYIDEVPSEEPDCSDCIKHGGDWDCDHMHCHKGSDPISRQAAIETLKVDYDKIPHHIGRKYAREVLDTVWDRLNKLPTVEPMQWIPCSERLPKKDGRYQVTRHDDVTNTEFIDILWYEGNLWWNRHSTGDYAVTAWMPLPAPYKGGDADGT